MFALLVAIYRDVVVLDGKGERLARQGERVAELLATQLDVGEVDERQALAHLGARLPGEGEGVFHRRELAYRFAQDLEGGGFRHPRLHHRSRAAGDLAEPIGREARVERALGLLQTSGTDWKADRGRPERRYGLFCCSASDSASCNAPRRFLQLPAAARGDADRHRRPVPRGTGQPSRRAACGPPSRMRWPWRRRPPAIPSCCA